MFLRNSAAKVVHSNRICKYVCIFFAVFFTNPSSELTKKSFYLFFMLHIVAKKRKILTFCFVLCPRCGYFSNQIAEFDGVSRRRGIKTLRGQGKDRKRFFSNAGLQYIVGLQFFSSRPSSALVLP